MTAGDLVTPVGRVDLSANGLNERPRDEREKETGMRVFSMVTRLCLRNIYLYIQVRASGSMELVRAANQRIRIALHCFVRFTLFDLGRKRIYAFETRAKPKGFTAQPGTMND